MIVHVDYQEGIPAGGRLDPGEVALLRGLAGALEPPDAPLALFLVGDDEIARLNREYRGIEGPTDVLSFGYATPDEMARAGVGADGPQSEEIAGEIYVSVDAAWERAVEEGRGYGHEILRLFLHGALHILGFGHEDRDRAEAMRAEEIRLLRLLGEGGPIEPVTLLRGVEPERS